MDMIGFIDAEFEMSAEKNFMEMQPGDVYATYADVAALEQEIGFKPATSLREGIGKFVQWYRDYHGAV
jgi:UDP-glucuronate 4-epimerase